MSNAEKIKEIIDYIVPKTLELNQAYISDKDLKINYSAIFCQSSEEYESLNGEVGSLGAVVENTPTGPLYKLHEPIQTVAGPLWLLKIRKPYPTHPQRGDADFTLVDYNKFKEQHLADAEHFKVMNEGTDSEMIELRDPAFDVLSYFSKIPLTKQAGIE